MRVGAGPHKHGGTRQACWLALGLALAGLTGLAGCSSAGYYWQSVSGHVKLMHAARPVGQWLADDSVAAPLKERLAMSQRIRDFAVTELKLPDNASYRSYADLQRSAAVWNVVAAPEFSLTLKTWCFPVAGCVGYRGYFNEADAKAEAARVAAEGLEVSVYGVPAYSTLGWLDWAGGDPLLNTFIRYPEGELARLIFHELAHQVVYVKNDTAFNESFSTAVERLGGARWLAAEAARGNTQAASDYAGFDQRRQQFRMLTQRTRRDLDEIYKQNEPKTHQIRVQAATKVIAKETVMQTFRSEYTQLKAGWGGYAGYDAWVRQANNASFGAQAAYDDLVPGFEALFERENHDWPRFYKAVRRLAALPKAERDQALKPPFQLQ
ncbi:MAG: aminopeptidase [Polaromonas sp.]|nr:aminopeptidase [Polaromonas sp.]